MIRKLRDFFTIACLFATSVVTIATSSKRDYEHTPNQYEYEVDAPATKHYYAASNCPQAVNQERITVIGSFIDFPKNLSFLQFGIPSDRLNISKTNQIIGEMNGRLRSCVRSETIDHGVPLIVFTCSEDNSFLCQVTFELDQ